MPQERHYRFATVDVFTDRRFGGNQLAVFPDAGGLSDGDMQAIAAEFNFSETTFVLPPVDPQHHAHVRIFNRTSEMPFAGHPNVGTAFVLARTSDTVPDEMLFEEQAGLVGVRLRRGTDGSVVGAEIDAPRPLMVHRALPASIVAPCLSLDQHDVRDATHPPVLASVGVDFVIVEVERSSLARAMPDLAAFRQALAAVGIEGERLSIYAYAHDDNRGVRARMFAPLSGTWEDPATGSATATLGALLAEARGVDALAFTCVQGVEMGRPSTMEVRAWRSNAGVRATVGGCCVPVTTGTLTL